MDLAPVKLRIDSIEVGERLRDLDEDHAAFIGHSIVELGQFSPIIVRPADENGRHLLVAGLHRLIGASRQGLTAIEAVIMDVDDLDARMVEISENLHRRDLSVLDRAVHLAELQAIYEARHPQTKHGGDRKSDQARVVAHLVPPSFAEHQSSKLGVDASTIRRAVARAKGIPRDVREQIAATEIAQNGALLDELAKLEPALQRKAVKAYLAAPADDRPRFKDMLRAFAARGAAPEKAKAEAADPNEKLFREMVTLWRRAPAAVRQRYRAFIDSAEGTA